MFRRRPVLLDDLAQPRLLDRVLALVARGQVEPLGGGFYEPILPVLPRADALDQLGRLRDWWTRRVGRAPIGAWQPTASRVNPTIRVNTPSTTGLA